MTEEKARQAMRRAIEAEMAEESLSDALKILEVLKEKETRDETD